MMCDNPRYFLSKVSKYNCYADPSTYQGSTYGSKTLSHSRRLSAISRFQTAQRAVYQTPRFVILPRPQHAIVPSSCTDSYIECYPAETNVTIWPIEKRKRKHYCGCQCTAFHKPFKCSKCNPTFIGYSQKSFPKKIEQIRDPVSKGGYKQREETDSYEIEYNKKYQRVKSDDNNDKKYQKRYQKEETNDDRGYERKYYKQNKRRCQCCSKCYEKCNGRCCDNCLYRRTFMQTDTESSNNRNQEHCEASDSNSNYWSSQSSEDRSNHKTH